MTLAKEDQYLVTGCNENELLVWKIFFANDAKDASGPTNVTTLNTTEEDDVDDLVNSCL